MIKNLILFVLSTLSLTACFESSLNSPSLIGSQNCSELGAEVNCEQIDSYKILMLDSFSRQSVVPSFSESLIGWRRIIDDMGRIVADEAGNNVNVEVVEETELGPAAEGSNLLVVYGRQGSSTHNIYLVTEALRLNEIFPESNLAMVKFKYLPVNLEQGEYLRLEVCNDSLEACGVGESLTTQGLNSSSWRTVYETEVENLENSFNGKNHNSSDYITKHIPLYLNTYLKSDFVIRFNVRMTDGFIDNNPNNPMEDGVLLDEVQITAVKANDVSDEDDPSIDTIISEDPP